MSDAQWVEVAMDSDVRGDPIEYGVRFLADGSVEVCRIINRSPVSRSGNYQIDRVWRRIKATGPVGLRAVAAAARILDNRAAIAKAEGTAP
jgi:hypothetical protein